MIARTRIVSAVLIALAMTGCARTGDLVLDNGVGISAVRGSCPSVGIADFTGDITQFREGGATTAADIDVVGAMTNLRATCNDSGEKVYSAVSFKVLARRSDTRGSRTVTLPYFITVVRGGNAVISKRIASVTLNFADGQERAEAAGTGGAYIDKAEATLPKAVHDRITRKRKAGDDDAALDPLADPEVKAAVARATFDVMAGFQLTNAQLAYNATR